MRSIPSFLMQSKHGIWYFRCRIPKHIKIKYNTTKNEIKRSLNTRVYSVALKKSRGLWVQMEKSDYTLQDMHNDMESDTGEGRKILKKYLIALIESKETGILEDESVDNFFVDTDNSDSEVQALFMSLNSNQKELFYHQIKLWASVSDSEQKKILLKLKEEITSNESISKSKSIIEKNIEPSVSSPLLSDVIENYIEWFIASKTKGNNAKPINKDTINTYRSIYKEFVFIIGKDVTCSGLNKEHILKFNNDIWKLPVGFMKGDKFKDKTKEEIIKIKDEKGLPCKSNSKINKNVMRIKALLKWFGKEDYIEKGLEEHFDPIPADDEKDNEKRFPFNPDELNLLFNNAIYEEGKFKKEKPSRYWIPLITLFSGMRGNEIAQLFGDDIKKDKKSGVWFIDIVRNDKRLQKVKTKNSRRKIPVHGKLIELGFIKFANKRKTSMLFPELYKDDGNHYKTFGNMFNRKNNGWKWKLGVTRDKVSFHSFRHNVIDFIEKADIDKRIACYLVGHNYAGGLISNYIKPDEFKELQKAVNKIKYSSIDWSKIPVSRKW